MRQHSLALDIDDQLPSDLLSEEIVEHPSGIFWITNRIVVVLRGGAALAILGFFYSLVRRIGSNVRGIPGS